MSRVLLLGGYGGFGGRIAPRLLAAGHEVLVAGRSLAKARAFCAGRTGMIPLLLDRSDIAAALADQRPEIVVDASGPFQTLDYDVPSACIAARVHYVDIADGRDFVCGIGVLDEAAKSAGVVILSGASSVPALSGAVVRRLAQGMDRVRAVEMAISASNKATAGPAVAEAILGQVGQPLRIWRGQRWDRAFGWQEMRTLSFLVPRSRPIGRRAAALVDVPDLALLPGRLPGRPAITFRAGTELAFQNWALWLASWLVRARWVSSLAPLARWLRPLQSLTRRWGSDRSAMCVRMFGDVEDRRIERRWTLIADEGHGPEIPSLSVPPLVERILSGQEQAGARDAGWVLDLDDYAAAFSGLAIRQGMEECAMPAPLYARIMQDRFDRLPAEVRAMHDIFHDGGASGEAEVAGAANPVAALVARVVGFPPAGRYPLHVHFSEDAGVEIWTRDFGGRRFRSHLSQHGPWILERFGPIRFAFDLPSDDRGLAMVLRRWWLWSLPLPRGLAPKSTAQEYVRDERFHFDVAIALPLFGRLVHYRGWLVVD